MPWGRGGPAPYTTPLRLQPDPLPTFPARTETPAFPFLHPSSGPAVAKLGGPLGQELPLWCVRFQGHPGSEGCAGVRAPAPRGITQSRGPQEGGERRSPGRKGTRSAAARSASSSSSRPTSVLPSSAARPARSPMKRIGKVMKSRKTCGTTLSASTKQPLLRTPWSTR